MARRRSFQPAFAWQMLQQCFTLGIAQLPGRIYSARRSKPLALVIQIDAKTQTLLGGAAIITSADCYVNFLSNFAI